MILGGIFVVLIIAGVIGFTVLATKGKALDEESKAYVDKITPIILANLNQETLFIYASEELKNSATQEEFDKMFNWFKKLGKFIEYKESSGQVKIFVTVENGKQITGVYVAQVEFEKGPATVQVNIEKNRERWEIIGFRINSKALINESLNQAGQLYVADFASLRDNQALKTACM